jgi:hypothetical protein
MKTPILRPASEAVLFGFERIGMMIRIGWLPIVLSIGLYAASFLLLVGSGGFPVIDASGDPEAVFEGLLSSPGFAGFYFLQASVLPLLVSLILSCVYVAATRAATLAEYEPPRLPFYFALGGRELRYFVTRILYALLIIAATVAIGGVAAAVILAAIAGGQGVDGQAKALVIAPAAALGVALFILWMWVLLRFLPVLPIAAVENRISFGDAWKMTKGNFWRLLFSGALFLAIMQGVLWVFILAIALPSVVIVGLFAAIGYGFAGESALLVFGLLALVAIPAMIAFAAFGVGAQAAFPARIYAYLSGCGDDCKI